MKERWEAAVAKLFPQGAPEGFPGYPLLGPENPQAEARAVSPWRLRLSLLSKFSSQQLEALLDDVEEVVLGPEFDGWDVPERLDCYRLGDGQGAGWRLEESEDFQDGPLPVRRDCWRDGARTRFESRVTLDGQILRNLSWLASRPPAERWVVSSSRSASGEAEELVADTLAYWTGAVAGVAVLEVAEQPDEGFESLWNRLSALRLLRHEADLARPGDPLAGAGFFTSCPQAR